MKSYPYISILLFGFSFLILACKSNEKSGGGDLDISPAFGVVWLHSHEEDQGENKYYRHDPWEFPPSRGRVGFKLMEESELEYWAIGPTDIPQQLKGKWSLKGQNLYFELIGNGVVPGHNLDFQIVDLKKDLIILKNL